MDDARLTEELVGLVSELASRAVAPTDSLASAGIDSLGIMSIVSWLADEAGVSVTLDELLGCETVQDIATLASAPRRRDE